MSIAVYQQVAEDLLRKIRSGKLPVGSLRVLRQYRDAARTLVEVTQSFYPEGRYSLATRWVRAGEVAVATDGARPRARMA